MKNSVICWFVFLILGLASLPAKADATSEQMHRVQRNMQVPELISTAGMPSSVTRAPGDITNFIYNTPRGAWTISIRSNRVLRIDKP